MLSVSLVFGVNDVLALKDFNTFLNNFLIHEKPSFLERYVAKKAQAWIQRRAIRIFNEIQSQVKESTINVALNEMNVDMFTVLALANDPLISPKTGEELFLTIASTELHFNKLQKPRQEQTYK